MTSVTDEIERQHRLFEEHQKKLREQIHGRPPVFSNPEKKIYGMKMRNGKYVIDRGEDDDVDGDFI